MTNSTVPRTGHSLPQELWSSVLSTTGEDPFTLYWFWLTLVGHIIIFGYGGLYVLMDLTEHPRFLRRYKVQEGTNTPMDMGKFKRLLPRVLFNQLIINTVANIALYGCQFYMHGPSHQSIRELPSIAEALTHLTVSILLAEIIFFYSHWALHHRALYKYIHKIHHEWTAPIAWEALYSHPIEHIISNLLSITAGPLLLGSHISMTMFWAGLASFGSVTSHSGYHLPFFRSPEAHDYHHLKFNQCYGVMGFLDTLHGTNRKFKKSVQGKRHRVFFSTKAAKEIVLEDKRD